MDAKEQILQRLLVFPTANEKSVFNTALHDGPLCIRIAGAEGLWAIGNSSGLDAIIKETDESLENWGMKSEERVYDKQVSFLRRCNTANSRETIYKCLGAQNPYLRKEAIDSIPSLRMEKAVRALPELFYDPFILGGSYTEYSGNVARTVPPRRVCDDAAETFTKVVPDAPKFDGTTAETQEQSIKKLKQWWQENGSKLKWDEKHGVLVLPKKLKSDSVAAIRSALPKRWTILKVEENAYPPLRRDGKGKAIYFYSPQQKVGVMQDKASVVYLMPAEYEGGRTRRTAKHRSSQRPLS